MSPTPFRILIAEDEPLARERLRQMLRTEAGFQIVAEAMDGPQAVLLARRHRPEIMLLDIQLPGLNGFEVLTALKHEAPPAVIFLTAHGEHAVRAFDAKAVDYVMKPFTRERLRRALERALAHCHPPGAVIPARAEVPVVHPRIALRTGNRSLLISSKDILYALSANTHCRVFLATGSVKITQSLSALHERLPKAQFARISRFAVVNVAKVASLEPKSNGDQSLFLGGGKVLTLTRRRRLPFLRLLKRLASGPGFQF